MENELVRYSRAGDVFHYRWAARRCLRMITPNSPIKCLVIEGSKEDEVAGEYVIDVSEYISREGSKTDEISYFQLKHSTTQIDTPFVLSDLKDTIEGFAKRYSEISSNTTSVPPHKTVSFSIITNRPVAFKQDLQAIVDFTNTPQRFLNTLEKYTNLSGKPLQDFCSSLKIIDDEGDYRSQREELQVEISQLLAGVVENSLVDSITALVQDQALPGRSGQITREDILKRFGITSEKDLFPASPEFEDLEYPIKREQHENLLQNILTATSAIIIHAAGGVGKSVVARHLAASLPKGSLGIVYDCFGSGSYRNRSQTRHRYRDALVQIINEIASLGLCELLIPRQADQDDAILRAFLHRIEMASSSLQKADNDAVLVIFIDAADNAEMAAQEFSQPCFAHELLRERLPNNCRIVMLCRTERIYMLKPADTIQKSELSPFSQNETLIHLKNHFPQATHDDGVEFWRLTAGNPRVQANVLSLGHKTVSHALASLGPFGTTVNEQINKQLVSAVSKLKENVPGTFQKQIDAICLGLANLSPLIPIKVLAAAAEVDTETVKSFIADLGRPLWLSDDSVQFRDEPTETWFRENYSASTQQIISFVSHLKPLAAKYTYVAEVLPSLLLQSGQYDELINLALSDSFLPEDSPIDQRNIRVYRLQFAFKAALKQKRYADAAKLALRAGEEVAGDSRQLELLKNNVDLIAPLQSQEKVQELAFRRLLRSNWDGSENVYSASLLSNIADFKGEARGYLRAAEKWLRLYFEERKNDRENRHDELLRDEDIVEMAAAHFNLFGPEKLVDFLLSWKPPDVAFRVGELFIKRLVDIGDFEAINAIARIGARNQYLMIALTKELLLVGRFPPKPALKQSLNLLRHKRARIPKPDSHWHEDKITSAIISFVEACAAASLSNTAILRVRRHYISQRASHMVTSDYQDGDRDIFLRAVALESVLSGNFDPDLQTLMPKKLLENEKGQGSQDEIKEFKQVVGSLLPWYILRFRLLAGDIDDFSSTILETDKISKAPLSQRWRDYDRIPFEISRVRLESLSFSKGITESEIQSFFQTIFNKDNKIQLTDRLKAVRAVYRLEHLSGITNQLEQSCYEMVKTASDEGPETKAGWYIDLARAVLPASRADAAAYFDCAVEAVSKFGDEIVERWEAVVSVAKRSAEQGMSASEMAYRFIRCAELVGDTVAREKYFSRNEAIRVCSQLCPASAFAALSRWRDRDIGWFSQQIPALAHEAVISGTVSPSTGWALSAFFDEWDAGDFAVACLEKEKDAAKRQYIFDTAVWDMRLQNTSESDWRKLGTSAQKFSLSNNELGNVIAFFEKKPTTNIENTDSSLGLSKNKESSDFNWDEILNSLNLTTSAGISCALDRFRSNEKPRHSEIFWQEIFKRIPESNASDFLKALVHAESAGRYDIQHALEKVPGSWRGKISVKRIWNNVLSLIAQRFAQDFASYGGEYFLKQIGGDGSAQRCLQEGTMEGLSGSCDLVDASALFGFVRIASPFITPSEASDLLDFALSRFEEHIDDDYADGLWAEWLAPPLEMSDAFAGFVWSALGAPRSAIRWQATHCVRRLVEADCQKEISSLFEWMHLDKVGPFGSNKFPFYNLHARQYLLIAMARVAIDFPEKIKSHHKIFEQLVLGNFHHVLIQEFAAQVALSIEKIFPDTYDRDVIEQLRQIGISKLPVKEIEYRERLETPWHAKGEVDQNLKLHFGYDFDRYWFDPLGDVFGVSTKQVEELAREVLLKSWCLEMNDDFVRDPREHIWRSRRHERETWHSHSSYPQTDNYSFYLSYHAMFTVAAKLFQHMPVVRRRDWCEDEWSHWLHRHMLTRSDGRWLADRRDPAPLERRSWIGKEKTEHWRWEIVPDDFLEGLVTDKNGERWLHVSGHWSDSDGGYSEKYHISSALVSRETSQSLLNAMLFNEDTWNCYLPFLDDDHQKVENSQFKLKRFVWSDSSDKQLDDFDPYAGGIEYPPYQVSKLIMEQLDLKNDADLRKWHLPGMTPPALACEIWSQKQWDERKEPTRYGKRMGASLTFLERLCGVTGDEIIFHVQIERQLPDSYKKNDEVGYLPPYSKIFILSENGTLRDEKRNYQLR